MNSSFSFTSFLGRLFRRKSLARESLELSTSQLARVLTVWDLTALGVGSTLGLGIYVLAGTAAKDQAGPAVTLSFLIAAIASLLAGLCFAEFGARVPSCGSAYIYAYVTIGEGIAFLMGWNLILEFMLSTSSVARGYSGYVDHLLGNPMRDYFRANFGMEAQYLAKFPDLFALAIVLVLTAILSMGVKESTRFNNVFTICNLLVVVYVVLCGLFKVNFHNWNIHVEEIPSELRGRAGSGGFLPFGIQGILAGAARCFFGFQGFDSIPAASEEARNPRYSIPLAICLCLFIVFVAYFGIAAVLTLIWPYYLQDSEVPLPYAFQQLGWPVAQWVVSIGTLFGLSTSLVGALFPLPRIIYAMAEDGLLFSFLSRVNYNTLTPTTATLVSGMAAGLLACLFNLEDLVDLMSLSTLLSFGLVAASIIILRYQPEENISATVENSEITGLLAGVADNQLRNSSRLNELRISIRDVLFNRVAISTHRTGQMASWITVIFVITVVLLSYCISSYYQNFAEKELWIVILIAALTAVMLSSLVLICRLPQSHNSLLFKVPLVPFLPALSIVVNVYLMFSLRTVIWAQYGVYMVTGLLVYVAYSWRNSKEEYRMHGAYNDK